jgi:hypothetical protein
MLGSGHNRDMIEDQVDALWTQAHLASDSLASYIPPLVVRGSLDGTGVG